MKTFLLSPGVYWPASLIAILVLCWWSKKYSQKITARLQNEVSEEAKTKSPVAPVIKPSPDSPFLAKTKQSIAANIARIAEDNRVPTLINELANAQLNLRWEVYYRTIFQSHIAFLQLLSHGSINHSRAEAIYAAELAHLPSLQGVLFNDWLRHLVGRELVLITADGIKLSPSGEEFLIWKLRHSIPDKS